MWRVADWGSAEPSRSDEPQFVARVVRLGPGRRSSTGQLGGAREWEGLVAISEVSRYRQCSRSDGSTEVDHAFAFMAVEQEPAARDANDAAGRLCSGYRMAVI